MLTTELICITATYLFVSFFPKKNLIKYIITGIGGIQSILALLQYFYILESSNAFFSVTGFFGNPGQMGCFQTACLIICWQLLLTCNKTRQKVFLTLCLIFIAASILLSDSRSAILSSFVGIAALYHKSIEKLYKTHRWIILPTTIGVFFVAFLMYCYRSESVIARLFIWKISLNMFLTSPILGIGHNGFIKEYMLYQSEYFLQHPNSNYISVADNVMYPYNEALHILVEYGILGFILTLSTIIAILKKAPDDKAGAPFIALLFFSMFSYPTYKLGLLILYPICAGFAAKEPAINKKVSYHHICIISAIISIASCWNIYHENVIESHYKFDKFDGEISEKNISIIRPTCENWCLIGDYYVTQRKYPIAEQYYKIAANMIPSRLTPKYSLWKLYLLQDKTEDAHAIAQRIMEQRTKIENTTSLKIRSEIREWLSNFEKSSS